MGAMCCASAFLGPLAAQSADEIVARMIQARGGEERLRQAKTVRLAGTATIGGGIMHGTFTWTQARPNSMLLDLNLGEVSLKQGFDGSDAWEIKPAIFGGSGKAEAMVPEIAAGFSESADFDGPFLDFEKKGHQIELAGKEEIDGKTVFHLRIKRKSGKVVQEYVDAETYYPIKIVSMEFSPQMGREVESVQLFSDFKVVDGINVAHRLESRIDGEAVTLFEIKTVEWDVEVDEGHFKRP